MNVSKFTQQIRRCYPIDTLIDKDRFMEVVARLQMGPAKIGRRFVRLDHTALNYTVQHGDLACLSRVYYPGHNYPKQPRDSQIRTEP